MNISGNTVLITGGARGIGFSLAEAFLARANTVIVCGRSADTLSAARSRFPALRTLACDVSRAEDRVRLQKTLAAEFPSLNVVVHNAGAMSRVDFRSRRTSTERR